jgi:hypothetical protein
MWKASNELRPCYDVKLIANSLICQPTPLKDAAPLALIVPQTANFKSFSR